MDPLSPQWDVFARVAATLTSAECSLAINILDLRILTPTREEVSLRTERAENAGSALQ